MTQTRLALYEDETDALRDRPARTWVAALVMPAVFELIEGQGLPGPGDEPVARRTQGQVAELSFRSRQRGFRFTLLQPRLNELSHSLLPLPLLIGDRQLGIRREAASTPWLTELVWSAARRLRYARHFLPQVLSVEDDHVQPLLGEENRGGRPGRPCAHHGHALARGRGRLEAREHSELPRLAHDGRDRIVGHARNLDRVRPFKAIRARRRDRQNMDIDPQTVHVLEPTLDILAVEFRRIDPAFEPLVVKVAHAAVRIGLFENHGAVEALHRGKVGLREKVSLKIDYHLSFDPIGLIGLMRPITYNP